MKEAPVEELAFRLVPPPADSVRLRPFWRYSGAKWRIAKRYPPPLHSTIIEPFAGAAGYALRWPDRKVILVEKYPVIAAVWRYLLRVTPTELRALPHVTDIRDLPSSVPQEAKWLIGLRFCSGDSRPRVTMSPWTKDGDCWLDSIAHQVEAIRHWKVIEGDYTAAPNVRATWFIDPPYQVAGAIDRRPGARNRVRYPCGADDLDFSALAGWCRERQGQALVCENVGATWLPFKPLYEQQTANPSRHAGEALWVGGIGNGSPCRD